MKDKTGLLNPGGFYHIYNRANGNEKLFLSDENYRYFLRRYEFYISPVVNTFCYCLMPNHFHFLVEIKEEDELKNFFIEKDKNKPLSQLNYQSMTENEISNLLSKKISLQFSHFFNSYTQAFNKQYGRRGGLFMRPFKRLLVTDEQYLFNLVRYIHQNPVTAGLCFKPETWQHSSYHHILNNSSSLILKDQVIEWFDDKENFIFCHRTLVELDDAF